MTGWLHDAPLAYEARGRYVPCLPLLGLYLLCEANRRSRLLEFPAILAPQVFIKKVPERGLAAGNTGCEVNDLG